MLAVCWPGLARAAGEDPMKVDAPSAQHLLRVSDDREGPAVLWQMQRRAPPRWGHLHHSSAQAISVEDREGLTALCGVAAAGIHPVVVTRSLSTCESKGCSGLVRLQCQVTDWP